MLKVNRKWYLFLIVWFTFIPMERSREIPFRELKNESSKQGDEKGTNNKEEPIYTEIEDEIYDDYMKIAIFSGPEFRAALSDKDRLWANGIVPYEISDDYKKEEKKKIQEAMEEFRNKTCIRFQERKKEKAYIFIMPGTGCSAVVGKVPNAENKVNLNENCFVRGIILHELMHTLGFIHEQNRPDRDEYVTIDFDNIRNGSEKNFDKHSSSEVDTFNLTYDYGSVMHYGAFDFAVNKSEPVIITTQNGTEIGQREGFSDKDLQKINIRYNCDGKQNATNDEDESLADDSMDNSTEENPTNHTGKKDEKLNGNKKKGFLSRYL